MADNINESNLMKHLMDNIKDNIYFMDRSGRIIMINQAGAEWLGFSSPEEVIGKTDLDLFTNEHGRDAYEDEQRIVRTGVPILGKEERETWADGHETWVSTSKLPLRDDTGKIIGTFGISRDITDHKNAELRAVRFAEENRRFREEMEEELRIASELQKTFLPSTYPVFALPEDEQVIRFSHHYHAGSMVGGDFCSIRKLSKTEAGILLCDVMGHGVRAALGTAIIRAVVEEISEKEKDPARFLEHMNRVLLPILRQGDQFVFSTACYMVLDVSTGRLRYANAGHPVPIVLESEKDCGDWLADASLSGPALAVSDDAVYQTYERVIAPDDAVLMFTDGIYEVVDTEEQEFGEERLLAMVSAYRNQPLDELFPSLLEEVRKFSAEGEFDDDVCLVGFRLKTLLSV